MVKKVVKKTVTETTSDDGMKKTVVKEHAPKVVGDFKKSDKSKAKSKSELKEKRMTAKERDELLIENFVGLQHAMTNMSIKFGMLSDNMSKLLSVFEEAAKGFVVGDKSDDKDMLVKIDSLLDQNKTIAKGLVIMEERVKTRVEQTKEAEKTVAEAGKSGSDVRHKVGVGQKPVEHHKSAMLSKAPYIPSRPKPLPRI
ncbi:hypothetical protein KAS08_05250 [Candidatus Pacearchaeota archaeon]|nr:hypothetical protein [Candidatus Pacearchaeota archaeon]